MGATLECCRNSIWITFASEDSIVVYVTVATWLRQGTSGLAHDLSFVPTTKIKDYFKIYATYCHRDKFFDQFSKLCSMAKTADH